MYSYAYPRAALTVDVIVFARTGEKISVLLIRRGGEPFKHMWALPGGFINMDETLETACRRELLEETGLAVGPMMQFRAYDAIGRDPRHRTISVVFSAQIDETKPVMGDDDAVDAGWFDIANLPEMAFDHLQILCDFFSLQNK